SRSKAMDIVNDLVIPLAASPWIYLLLFAFIVGDSVDPHAAERDAGGGPRRHERDHGAAQHDAPGRGGGSGCAPGRQSRLWPGPLVGRGKGRGPQNAAPRALSRHGMGAERAGPAARLGAADRALYSAGADRGDAHRRSHALPLAPLRPDLVSGGARLG